MGLQHWKILYLFGEIKRILREGNKNELNLKKYVQNPVSKGLL